MPLAAGTRLGPYEIVSALGAGGMGEVYKARDPRLDRMVAIKVLPADKVADPDRKRRFIQEARAASALNHPHIVTIHDISADNGIDFIVMEYVPGKSLDYLIPARGLRAPEALKYAIQIADAFAAAHAAGIVHRDLKPANVMVTDAGQVKVLDFGLAKLSGNAATGNIGPEDATRTAYDHTQDGAIAGTIAYMSPEQAEARPVDARSDIFSFGSVLYEVLTGRKAFSGDSKISTLSAILRQEPKPLAEIVPDIPRDLEKMVQRCLRKDRDRRFQHMADLKVALQDAKEESDSGVSATGAMIAKPRASRLPVSAAVAAIALLAAAGAWWASGRAHKSAFQLVPFTTSGSATDPAFSPDGKLLAFSGAGPNRDKPDIYVQQIGVSSPLRLTTDPEADAGPVFSPDGRYIAFVRLTSPASLILIPALGGPPRKLGPVDGSLIDFSPDGKTIAVSVRESPGDPLAIFLVSVENGGRKRLTAPPKGSVGDVQPRFSPDGRTIALVRVRGSNILYEVVIVTIGGGETETLSGDNQRIDGLSWMPDGREIVYAAHRGTPSQLWTIGLSGGTPQPLSLVGENALLPVISRDGRTLAYVRRSYDLNIWRRDLPSGANGPSVNAVKLIGSTRKQGEASYSRDGGKIAFSSDRSGSDEIWVSNADGSSPVQLTSLGFHTGTPRWSPDGRRIAFDFTGREDTGIYVIDAEGGAPRRLTSSQAGATMPSWSSSARWIYFHSTRTGRYEIWRIPAEGGREVQLTHQGGANAQESPDGKTLYYFKGGKIWEIPTEGGVETPVEGAPAGLRLHAWAPCNDGLYVMAHTGTSGSPEDRIQFFDFASGKVTDMGRLDKPYYNDGFSLSPDRHHVIFTQVDQNDSDIMLVKNFR